MVKSVPMVEVAKVMAPEEVVAYPVPTAVIVPVLAVRQVPPTAIQPAVTLIPLAKLDEAVAVEVRAPEPERSRPLPAMETPFAKVLVPCPAPTVIAAAKVEVAVVEVAKTELKNPCAADICVEEALPLNCTRVVVAFPARAKG